MKSRNPKRRHKRATVLLSFASLIGAGRAWANEDQEAASVPLIQQLKFGVQAGSSGFCGSPTETTGHWRCSDFYDLSVLSRSAPTVGLHIVGLNMHSVAAYEEGPDFDQYENQEEELTGFLVSSQLRFGSVHLDGAIGPMGGHRNRTVYQDVADRERKLVRDTQSTLRGIGATIDLEWEILRHKELGTLDVGLKTALFAANSSNRPKDSRDLLFSWPMLAVGWISRP